MDLELKNFIALHRVVSKMDRSQVKIFDEYSLTTGQFAVLEVLFHKGDLSVGEVQEKILSSSGTMPLIVKNLITRDLVTKLCDPNDKRRSILHITDAGRSLMEELFPKVKKNIISMFDGLKKEEMNDLLLILKRLGGYNE